MLNINEEDFTPVISIAQKSSTNHGKVIIQPDNFTFSSWEDHIRLDQGDLSFQFGFESEYTNVLSPETASTPLIVWLDFSTRQFTPLAIKKRIEKYEKVKYFLEELICAHEEDDIEYLEREILETISDNKLLLLEIIEDNSLLSNVRGVAAKILFSRSSQLDIYNNLSLEHRIEKLLHHENSLIRYGVALGIGRASDKIRLELFLDDEIAEIREDVKEIIDAL